MKLLSMTCPNCNASLDNIDPNRKYCYCQYCGTKILIDNEAKKRETHIYDEARIKELEYAERARQDAILEKKRQTEITKKNIYCRWHYGCYCYSILADIDNNI